jgi:hypothetical protein
VPALAVRIDDLSEEKLSWYRQFRCSSCCYFIHRDESSLEDPRVRHDVWEEWYRGILARFGPCVKVASDSRGTIMGMIWFLPINLVPKKFDYGRVPYHLFKDIPVWELVPLDHRRDTLLIYCIFVPDEQHEGGGVGALLLQGTINEFRRPHPYLEGGRFSRIIVLAARNRQGPAGPEGFFDRFGFQPIAEYDELESVVMALDLLGTTKPSGAGTDSQKAS